MCELEIGKNIRLLRTTAAEKSQQPGGDALEKDGLADDQNDRDRRVNPDVIQMQILEPAGEKMEDQEKIGGHENGIDGELDEEGPEGVGFLLFRDRSAGHLRHFAVARALGRASLPPAPDFHLRPRGFFLRSSSLFSGKYG